MVPEGSAGTVDLICNNIGGQLVATRGLRLWAPKDKTSLGDTKDQTNLSLLSASEGHSVPTFALPHEPGPKAMPTDSLS
jgi:hypothetical protein